MKKYSMLQIDSEIHSMLKSFCDERGMKMGKLVEALIKDKITPTRKPIPTQILSTKI
jgi:hypothetical protein